MTPTLTPASSNPTTRSIGLGVASALGLLGCIVAANFVTSRYGVIPVGFGLMATAGTYFAGLTFILRDTLQDTAGKRWSLAVIVAGAALSFLLADPLIALASAVAFLLSEVCDLAVYTPLRKRGYVRAAIASNIVAAFVDTYIFLTIANFPMQEAFVGQIVGKLALTAAAVMLVVTFRAYRNHEQLNR